MNILNFLSLVLLSSALLACTTPSHFSDLETRQAEESLFSDEDLASPNVNVSPSQFDWDEELSNSKIWDDSNCAHIMADGSCAHEL